MPKDKEWRFPNLLVRKATVALPLYPQLGLEPNVYYIPPRRVLRPYLRQQFRLPAVHLPTTWVHTP